MPAEKILQYVRKHYNTTTDIAHALLGVLIVVSSNVLPVASILLFIAFIIYELDEKWTISDEAYKDILEMMVGMVTAVVTFILMKAVI